MRHTCDKIKNIVLSNPSVFQTDPSYHLSSLKSAPVMASTIWEIKKALKLGICPEKVKQASTPVYLMKDSNYKPLAIYKVGEKTFSSNPKKELAAYLLDHSHFALVPPVVLARFNHPIFGGEAFGSCHLFMGEGKGVYPWQGRLKSQVLPSSIRRVAALDIRLLNGDRHFGNLVISNDQIVPIDHTLILPEFMTRLHVHFDWLGWEESKTPFSLEEKEYIASLNPQLDRKILTKEIGLSDSVSDMYTAATTLLKMGVARGMTAFDIGKLIAGEKQIEKNVSPFCLSLEKIDRDNFEESLIKEMKSLCA